MNVESLFHEALTKQPEERAAFLGRACGDDTALRQRIEALLAAHANPGSFLGQPAIETQATIESPARQEQSPASASAAVMETTGAHIGPYKLLQKLGEGGMGSVWMAEQTEPVRRRVAIKVIKAGMDSAHVIARFEAERQALALMEHPNIAKVLDAGATEFGRPYFVMELVKGIPITKYCDQERLAPAERLELFLPVCQAVQHAHQKGVIHRDLKPSNVIIALYDGKPVPKVIDFGVAKATSQKLTERTMFTEVGQMVGTLEYMAPEQAELNNLDIDTRADIYSLGVLLYELLTGSPPFTARQLRSAAFTEMLRMIREVEPAKPSTKLSSSDELPSIAANRKLEPKRLTKLVHGDLDWVVMKCLEKERSRRYETANGLAADLQRYLHDEPVVAGPPGAGYRLRKFVRRNRVALSMATVVAATLVLGMVVSTWQAFRATRARHDAELAQEQADTARKNEVSQRQVADQRRLEAERHRAEAQRERAAAEQILSDMHTTSGLVAGDRGEPANAILWFANAARLATNDSDREIANRIRFRTWSRKIAMPLLAMPHSGKGIKRIAFHPNGKQFLIVTEASQGAIWRLPNGESESLPGGNRPIGDAVWSPSGLHLALGSPAGEVDVYDVPGGVRVRHFDNLGPIETLAFSANGRFLAMAGNGVRVWDSQTKALAGAELPHPGKVLSLTFNGRADRIATLGSDGCTRVFSFAGETAEPKPLFTPLDSILPRTPDFRVVRPLFIDDDRALVTLHPSRTLMWSNAETGKEIRRVSEPKYVRLIALDWEGRHLLVGGSSGARLWDVRAAKAVGEEMRHANEVYSAAFSPDGTTVLTVGADRTARLWSVPAGKLVSDVPHQNDILHAAFSSDGQLFATAQADGLVRVWTLPRGNPQDRLLPVDSGLTLAKLSPDGSHVITTGDLWSARATIRRAQIYNLADGELTGPGLEVGGLLTDAAFSPDGVGAATIASTATSSERFVQDVPEGRAGRLQLWDWRTGHPRFDSVPMPSEPCSLAYSPDGKLVAAACYGGQILVADAIDGKLTLRCDAGSPQKTNRPFHGVMFAADGQSLVTWGTDSLIRVWQASTGQLRYPPLRHEQDGLCVGFSPDGRLLVTGSRDNTARVWDLATGQAQGEPLSHPDYVFSVCFSPDGQLLLTGCRDGSARVWDWRKGELLCPPSKHTNEVWATAFSPDGRSVLTSGADSVSRLWETRTGKPLTPPIPSYEGRMGLIAPNGHYAVLFARTRQIWLLHLGDLAESDDLARDDLVLLGELLSGKAVYEGDLAGLTTEQWIERWSAWSQRHKSYQRLQPEAPLAWHRYQVELNQASRQWSAVAWRLGRLIELEPNDGKLWRSLALAHTQLSRWESAIAAYKKALQLHPNDSLSNNNLAWILVSCPVLKLRNPAAAVEHGRRSVELDSTNAYSWNTLGVAHYRNENWRAAIEALEKAEALRPQRFFGFNAYFLAMAHWQLDEKEAARSWFGQAIAWREKLKIDTEEIQSFDAEAAKLLGLEETLSAVESSMGPNHARTLTLMQELAGVYQGQDDYPKAEPLRRERWNRYKALWPGNRNTIDAENHLGVCLMRLGELEEAERHLLDSYRDLQTADGIPAGWSSTYCSRLATLYDQWKKPELAAQWRQKATDLNASVPSDAPGRANLLMSTGQTLLQEKKYAEAELPLYEALGIRQKATPDAWETFHIQSLLGASLLGQMKFKEAELLLLQGYRGLKQREEKIPADAAARLREARERLVELYDAWQKPERAEAWRKSSEDAEAGENQPIQ